MYRQNENLVNFWRRYYQGKSTVRVLFLLGKGFDPRMNNILRLFLESNLGQKLDCLVFDFPNEKPSGAGKTLYEDNARQLVALKMKHGFGYEELKIDVNLPWDKCIAQMSRKVIDKDLSCYRDVILDVSSLPRAFYFNIGKVLFNKLSNDMERNLFFAVSENVGLDAKIRKSPLSDDIEQLVGFRSMSSREANLDRVNILISLMGEENIGILKKIYEHFKPSDMFPVFPFPSKNPRLSDDLLLKYREFFAEKQFTEPQNITYADEQNPFELYRIVSNMINGHQATFKPISEHVCFGIALLTSKLLSLGALLVGLENNNCVTIYNVSASRYEIEDSVAFQELNKNSEPFLLWITGEAYSED